MALAVSNNLDLKLSLAQSITQKRIDQAIERLSTGKRINSAKDDVGSLVQVSRLESEYISSNSSNRTAKNAQNILNIADDAAASVQSGLLRLRELAVQSANGTLSANDLVAINEETDQILTSIDQTSNSTNLGGLKLLDGTFTNKDFRLTNSENGVISLSFESLSHEALGLKNLDLSVHAGKSEIIGTNAADTITGKANIDKITSGAGNDQIIAEVFPEKRLYNSSEMPMTEAGIAPKINGDLYITLGNLISENKWSVRIYFKPMVRLIWLGAILMFIGGIISILTRKQLILSTK